MLIITIKGDKYEKSFMDYATSNFTNRNFYVGIKRKKQERE